MGKSFFAFCFQIMSYGLHAQFIQKLEVIPSNPTTEDSVRIFYELKFSWNGATKKSSLQYKIGDSLYFSGCYYNPGLAQAESYVVDTINFGKLNSGLHPFKFTRNIVWFPTDTFCSNIGYSVTFDTTINVTAASNVVSPSTISIISSLHPNPATTHITITGAAPNSTATITNLHGQVVLQSEIRNPQSEISVEALPPGLYFCVLQSGQERKVLRFVKQ